MTALEYLKSKEWSMGNGQCPDCYGAHKGWHGHPAFLQAASIGHEPDCPLAAAITELGGEPLMMGQYDAPDCDAQTPYKIQ